MKLRTKWMAAAVVLLLLGATGYPVFKNYQARKQVLQAQQEAQKTAPSITLGDADVVSVKMLALSQGLPIAGSIKAVNSAFVKARVVEIVDLSQLELEASLSAAESMQVKVGQTAQISIEGAATPVVARVVRANPSAVAGTRAVLVYLAIAPTTGLRQGLFGQGLLATGTQSALALPLSAVRTDKPLPYVQVVADGKVSHQTVQMGQRGELGQEAMVAVSGVSEGARVLVGEIGPVMAGTAVTGSGSGK